MFKDEQEHALFDILLWRRSRQDFFTIQLFNLMLKADDNNRRKLITAFPIAGSAFMQWYTAPVEEDFLNALEERFYTKRADVDKEV